MKYFRTGKAVFLKRPNRFIAHVMLDGREEIVHVRNTGRCRELLQPNASVILEESLNPARKTRYTLVGVYKNDLLINIDAQAPNYVVREGIKDNKIAELKDVSFLKREVAFGHSRFDFYFETPKTKGFIEVKGVTLEDQGIALFPDAPTERGTKHIYEMIEAVKNGYRGYLIFLIQMQNVTCFRPHQAMDPEFACALKKAGESGVKILAYDSLVQENEIFLGKRIRVLIPSPKNS